MVIRSHFICIHYTNVIMRAVASPITHCYIVYTTVCSGTDKRKYHSSASLTFVRAIHWWFPSQRASNAINVSIWWRHHAQLFLQIRLVALGMPSTNLQAPKNSFVSSPSQVGSDFPMINAITYPHSYRISVSFFHFSVYLLALLCFLHHFKFSSSGDIIRLACDMFCASFAFQGLSCFISAMRYCKTDLVTLIAPSHWNASRITGLGPDSILRCQLTSIGNAIVEIRRSWDRLISTMAFPILVRWHIYIESGPWSWWNP